MTLISKGDMTVLEDKSEQMDNYMMANQFNLQKGLVKG